MKLRNKRTGKIVELEKILFKNAQTEDLLKWKTYEPNVNSIAELNEKWEDYEPVEPLIKDKNYPERAEKARKTLKMWADANGFKKVSYHVDSYVSVFYNEFNPSECATTIEFGWIMEGLKPGTYGITELCGEPG